MEIPGYQILKELGRGGMATVYLALQTSFERKVAVKVLDAKAAADKDFAGRFIREAKIVAQLSHPHIVSVYDVGQQNGLYFMSMDYLAGGALPERIKRGLEKTEVIRILCQIASALSCLHEHGYIHRDIKPDNIMFRADGSAVLTDFGVARSQNAKEGLTQVGTIIGTPVYMSPEQINGGVVDGRADLYALGIVLYEMLMGEPPYVSEDFIAVAVKHLQDPLPELTLMYEEFQYVLDRCLAKNPEDRFQTAQALVAALTDLTKPRDTEKPAKKAPAKPIPPAKKLLDVVAHPEHKPVVSAQVKAAPPAKNSKPEGLHFDETMRKKWGVMKRYTLVCELSVRDAQTFSILFSRITTKLVDWHDERADQSEAINFDFYIPEWMFNKARGAIKQIVNSGETYAFLEFLSINVALQDTESDQLDSYVCKKETS
ncbi:MAG: serine/threonine protein kinase [Hahellaceae bacterium]|nr:serine/threonine protein kinase [Hahellaceae bacterium]MCP5211819.1 serine/threonine protein kinase [Hahellaceae bacterium]